MGLDTTHNCWHGSYSGFSRWRYAIAEAADWEWMDVPAGQYNIPDEKIPVMPARDGYDNSVYLGDWPEGEPADVLDVLMVHSDCEGVIPHRFLMPLADRLEALIPLLSEDWQERTEGFVAGLRSAYTLQEEVGFF